MMCATEHYFNAIKHSPDKEEKAKSFMCDVLRMVERYEPEMYRLFIYKLHTIAFGCHFDRELAEKAVAEMQNVDGTSGEHWTYEQTSQVLDHLGIADTVTKEDFYYLMNMLYSDFSHILGSDANVYAKMSKAYVNDPDSDEGKVFSIWFSQQ